MRVRLRWKILLFTVLPLVSLAFVTLWVVNRSISRQVHENVQLDLARASAVLDNMLSARERGLVVAGQVIVADPKFFSVLTIPGTADDPQLRATVAGVALDFNRITQTDLFEVTNAKGHVLASVGRESSSAPGRHALVTASLGGRLATGILVEPGAHYQVAVTPVVAGNRVIGALLLGSRIGGLLADQLRELTRSDVTFLSGRDITGTTIDSRGVRNALVERFARAPGAEAVDRSDGTVVEMHADEHTYLSLARPFGQTDPAAAQTYVMQRSLDSETAFLRAMQRDLVQLGIAAVVAALLAGYLIAERITSPVQRLVRGAEEMERGNFDYPLDVRHHDEIGYLARRFGDMRERHRAYVQSLQEVARVKSEFLTVASHELRTPISVIAGFQELMSAAKLGPITAAQLQALEAMSRSVQTLTRITEDATRMAQIHGDMLTLARSECDVSTLLERAVSDAVRDAPGRAVAVRCMTDRSIGAVALDGERMVVAIANLVRNGIRFTPDGGEVSVEASRRADDLEISVSDTGVGIAPDRQVTLFDASYAGRSSLNHHSSNRLEFNSAGLGLGLSIARGIVRAHRGTIDLRSQPGRGTTFVVRIPLETSFEGPGGLEAAA